MLQLTLRHLGLILLLAAVAPAAAQTVPSPGPLFSDPIPADAGLAFDPATDTRETFTAPDRRRITVQVQGPRAGGSYSRPIRADETADAYFPAVVREAIAAQAHYLRIPHGTYVFHGPAYCRDLASAACQAATACTVNQYWNCAPHWVIGSLPAGPFITPDSVSDLDIDLDGSTLAFSAPTIAIEILYARRVRLRNGVLDWPLLPIASLGTIVADPLNPGHNGLVLDDAYPVQDPFSTAPVQIQAVNHWQADAADAPGHFAADSDNPWETYFIFGNAPQPTYVGRTTAGAHTFSCLSCRFAAGADSGCSFFQGCANFDVFAPGERVIVRHYTYNGFAVWTVWSHDVTFQDIWLRTAPGTAFGSDMNGQRGLLFSRVTIERAPGRLISAASGGIQLSGQADFIIRGSVVAHQGDDGLAVSATSTAVSAVSGKSVTLAGVCSGNPHDNPAAGDVLALLDVNDVWLGNATAARVSGDCAAPVVTLDRAAPGAAQVLDVTQQASARVAIIGNAVGFNRGHGVSIDSPYARIARNRFTTNSTGGVQVLAGAGNGPPQTNLIVSDNLIRASGRTAATAGAIQLIAFGASGVQRQPAFAAIRIEDNRVADVPGPALVATAIDGFLVADLLVAGGNTDRADIATYDTLSSTDSVLIDRASRGLLCGIHRFGAHTGAIGLDPSDRDVHPAPDCP